MRVFFYFVLFFYPICSLGMSANFNKICNFFQYESDEYIIEQLKRVVGDLNCEIEGFTPLIWAIRFQRVSVVNYLIFQRKVNVNMVCSKMCLKTPLQVAFLISNKQIINILLQAGAKDFWGNTPENYSKAIPNVTILESDIWGDT